MSAGKKTPNRSEPDAAALTYRLKVLSNREIAQGVHYLTVRRPFTFRAGECVSLAVSDAPARFYSIASGETDGELGILYDVVPGGELTPRLARLSPGDDIVMSDPFGSFVDDDNPSVWIATGTGIAPFLSAARSRVSPAVKTLPKKALVYGARTPDRFYFADELTSLLGRRVLFCCSQCSPSDSDNKSAASVPWDDVNTSIRSARYPGRLTHWLSDVASTRGLPSGRRYFLCGSAGMIVQVRDLLIAAGVPYNNILSEIYF